MRAFSLFPRRPGESACGHAARHAAMQGWRSVPAFARGIGVVWSRLLSGEDVAVAAAAFGEPTETVAHDSGMTSPSSVRLRGETLSRRHWTGTAPIRFCPSCLAEDAGSSRLSRPAAWLRTWWDILAVVVCPVHLAPLATTCGCGATVSRQAPFSGRCPSCHAPLADTPSEAPVERALLDGQLYVLGRIEASARIECAVLDRSPLRDAIDAMDAVGRASGPGSRGHLPMDIGFEAFAGWPRSFDAALDGIAADTQGRAGRWGAAKAYGPLHGFASDAGKGTLASRMAKRMAAHADRNGVSPGRTLYGRKCGSGDLASLAEVSRRTGLSYARSRRLLLPTAVASSCEFR